MDRKKWDWYGQNGIIIIKADGKDSIPYLKELLEKFGIKSYTFADRDDNQNNNFDFMTIGRNLEEDVVDGLFNFSEEDEDKKRNVVYDILSEIFLLNSLKNRESIE